MRSTYTAAVAAAVLAAVVLTPSAAHAGEFHINACQADRSSFATTAFEDFATRGMKWKRACDPEGPGLRGLVTSNVVRGGRVARGARSVFVLDAPPGTTFARFRWSGQARRRDCRFALQLYAERPGAPAVPIKNVPANRRCPKPNRAQAAGWPRARTYDVAGSTRIVQRVVCVGAPSRRFCSARGLNYLRTFKAQAAVTDTSAPGVGVIQDNAFTRGEWVAGAQPVTYDASDNAGVRSARAVVGGAGREGQPRDCNYAQRVPCPNGVGQLNVDTRPIPEGSQQLAVTAEDAAGNVGGSAPITVRIDNTAPGAVPVAVEGGESWRNQNGYAVAWANPDEGDRAPVTAAHYQLCRAGTNECSRDSRSAAGIGRIDGLAVPAPGEWQVRVWRQDAAGNSEPGNASVPVTLRYDPEPPVLAFEPAPPTDPTRVSVAVTDRVSGLAGGSVEIAPEGTNDWRGLGTAQEGSRLTARIDDAQLAPGRYVVRATAHDQAGNPGTAQAAVTLPLRVQTVLRAGTVDTRRVRKTVGRRGHRRKVWRRKTVLRPSATVGYGRRVRVGGTLTNREGQPIAGAQVFVYSTAEGGPEQLEGTVSTDAQGRFSYNARGTANRTLRLAYAGSPLILPAQGQVTILTRGHSSLATDKRRAVNGGRVVFRGQVSGRPLPVKGKLIEIQVWLGKGRWQTFRTPRTDAAGNWRQPYRFRRTCGRPTFRFRVVVTREGGYPLQAGTSRTVPVTVQGPPCS